MSGNGKDNAIVGFLKKIVESPAVLLLVLGTILLLLGLGGGVRYNNWFPIEERSNRNVAIAIGVVLMVIGVVGLVAQLNVDKPRKLAAPKGDTIKITYPPPNHRVKEFIDVLGTVAETPPPDYHLWLILIFPDGTFVPVRRIVLREGQADWSGISAIPSF